MTYGIEILPSARRELLAVPKREQKRIDERILALADDPRPSGAKSLVGQNNLYRIRVGDYRVIYRIQDHDLLILVVRIGHRKDVYRSIGG